MSDSLTLREIRNELYELVIERAELERDITAQADLGEFENVSGVAIAHQHRKSELERYRAQLDLAIQTYGLAKAEKVDQIAYVLKRLERDAEFDETEGKRLIARAKARRAAKDRLKDYVKGEFIAAGETKVEGEHNTLKLEANPVSVDDYDVSLIPDALKSQTVKLDCATWHAILEHLEDFIQSGYEELCAALRQSEAIPDKTNIKAILVCPTCKGGVARKTCPECDESGYAPCSKCQGSGLVTSGPADKLSDSQCSQCGGSGNAVVPGAKLEFGMKLMIR